MGNARPVSLLGSGVACRERTETDGEFASFHVLILIPIHIGYGYPRQTRSSRSQR